MSIAPSKPFQPETEAPKLDEEAREAMRDQEAKDALRRSFEHGAPETGAGDDLNLERTGR